MNEETKLFYNLKAEKNADEWYENFMLMPSIEEFVALLPGSPRVLDLGCGGGYESMRLIKAGAQVVGVDFSEESIRIAKERCPEAQFELMDFRQLDGKKLGKFDGVFACASLIHISPKELPGVFAQVRGTLNKNGFCNRHRAQRGRYLGRLARSGRTQAQAHCVSVFTGKFECSSGWFQARPSWLFGP